MSRRLSLSALLALPFAVGALGAVSLLAPQASARGRGDVALDYSLASGPALAPPGVEQGQSGLSPDEARASGIAWLKSVQLSDGGWGAGAFGEAQGAVSDAATTSMAVLALVRDGGVRGSHQAEIERGVRYLVQAVESGPRSDPRVATPQGTQPQGKLGQLVDTHMTALTLGEVAGQLSPELDRDVQVALDTVIGKVQLAQNADGSFDGNGWAPVLSNSVAAMSLVQAQKKGVEVAPEVMERTNRWQDSLYDEDADSFDASTGAGVNLYSVASGMRMDKQARDRGYAGAGRAEAAARQQVTGEAADRLIAGFGSVGGEEMLSYMMISDTLAETGGDDWKAWDDKITGWLASIQNSDGSWAGHHCITSRTFVTATALMTLGAGEHSGRSDRGDSVLGTRVFGRRIFGDSSFGLLGQ